MVAGAAAADATRRAHRLPTLRVGLHLVVIEGPSVLSGHFGSDQIRRGIRYFAHPPSRRRLAAEIRAQFEAFAATGLRLDHANAHKHMHLHPTVGRMLIEIGRDYGLRAVRIPAEPAAALAACGTRPTLGAATLRAWTRQLRHQVARAGMRTTDHCFGIAWSGHMTASRVSCLLDHLPPGTSELYFHPAARRDALLDRLMPTYDHQGELDALLEPGLATRLRPLAATWSELCRD